MTTKNKDRTQIDDVMAILSVRVEEATRLFERGREAYFAGKGKEMSWKSVYKVALKVNQPYFIRRVWKGDKGKVQKVELPVLSVWEEEGWNEQLGQLQTVTARNAGLEVWHV